MTGIIIASHGKMAAASLELCEMLMGTQDKVETIGFCQGDSLETLMERYEKAIEKLGGSILVFTDLRGGSPCNVAMAMQNLHSNVRAVCGFNIPMLLQALDMRSTTEDVEELIREVTLLGKEAIEIL